MEDLVKEYEMSETHKVNVIDKLVQEKMKILESDPEYVALCDLIPKVLIGKERGEDFHGVTSDREIFERNKHKGTILLSKRDMNKWQEFENLCMKLAQKYGLDWSAVEDLAMGVDHPTVAARLSPTITAYLDPLVSMPKQFSPEKQYVAEYNTNPPLAAIEIMRRVHQLDEKTRDEIKSYLSTILEHMFGYRVVHLCEASKSQESTKIGLNVCLKVPPGYSARDVSRVYLKVDKKRREIMAALGIPLVKRWRQSKLLMQADTLDLMLTRRDMGIYGIIENLFAPTEQDESSPEQRLHRSVVNKRYKGHRLLKKRLRQ